MAQTFARAKVKECVDLMKAHGEQLTQLKKEMNELGHRMRCEIKKSDNTQKKLQDAIEKKSHHRSS